MFSLAYLLDTQVEALSGVWSLGGSSGFETLATEVGNGMQEWRLSISGQGEWSEEILLS